MQGFNSSQKACRDQGSFTRNEVFRSSKILVYHYKESRQATNNNLDVFNGLNSKKDYGPVDQNIKLETTQKSITVSSNILDDNYQNNLAEEELKTYSNSKQNIPTKYSVGNITNNSAIKTMVKNSVDDDKFAARGKKVGDIVSTSRSGHLIERKGETYHFALKNTTVDVAKGCDSNDNIINSRALNTETVDVNDNPNNNERNLQEREDDDDNISVSDNALSSKYDIEAPCGISLLERLIRSHPVWFLPGIQRAGAVHLLQGKEEGNFVVRQSSQPDTMAVSVRLPTGKGPYIEHYLIQANDGQLSLESSENMFESIPSLIAHYCQCCDELPVQLTLPATIREAKNRQQLSSLALLGQEFWRYPMANPRSPESQVFFQAKTDSSSSSDGAKNMVKENHEIILDLVPLHQDTQPPSLLSTFKSSPIDEIPPSQTEESKPKRPHTLDLIFTNSVEKTVSQGNKTPPQPPPRWTKPIQNPIKPSFNPVAGILRTNLSKNLIEEENLKSEITEGTFIPLSAIEYDGCTTSPQSDQTNMKSFGFEREKNSLRHFREENKTQLISPVSDTTGFTSMSFDKSFKSFESSSHDRLERVFKKFKKDGKFKESAHYQESGILESPSLHYYKSNVADKQSDYEDIWATDSFTTFKPQNSNVAEAEQVDRKDTKNPPDLLEKLETPFRLFGMEKKGDKAQFNDKPQDDCTTFESLIEAQNEGKQNSPFYAEPADALVVRRKGRATFSKSRHSDPFSFNNWSVQMNPYFSGGKFLDRIDSQNEMNDELNWKTKPSLSFDNIINLKKNEMENKVKLHQKAKNNVKAKPVRPPKVSNIPVEKTHQNWAVDSSWEFIGNELAEKEGERRFPSIEQQMDTDEASFKCTVQEMIALRFPQYKISKGFWNKISDSRENFLDQRQYTKSDIDKSDVRISAYDNLSCDRINLKIGGNVEKNSEMNCDTVINPCTNIDQESKLVDGDLPKNQIVSDTLRFRRRVECGSVTEDNEDAQTIFSEPWDSSRWENLLPSNSDYSKETCFENTINLETKMASENPGNAIETFKSPEKIVKSIIFKERQGSPSVSVSQFGMTNKEVCKTGASIRSYALHLASDKSTTFAQNIDNFIECTLESKETNPQIVMRNMRQFMSGMKNYLVKHGEREFEKQVEKERMKLKSTEFLNLDAILEGVMHKLVVRPLREHLYKLFVNEYIKTGAIQLLYENLSYARTKSLRDLGLKAKISPPSQEALEMICHFILKLQDVDSPLEKLDHLLSCVSTIIYSVKQANYGRQGIALGADDILPLFIWILIQSGFIAAEIEAEYMWGLLQPSLLSGEGCYYLTTLSSAVHVLKSLKSCDLDQTNRLTLNEWHCGDLKSVLKIVVPDELHGSILTKTLPVKPNMTTKDVCKIIAHKIRITNPQDYGLFRLVDGEETLLNDSDCPQEIKCQFLESGKHCTLAYKRIDAKIGWPRTA